MFREIINVYGKQQRAQYAPLWDARYDRKEVRVSAINGNTLIPVGNHLNKLPEIVWSVIYDVERCQMPCICQGE